jgi:hypothetical protein
VQLRAFSQRELQGVGDTVDRPPRYGNVTTLLEPGIQGDADPGEFGDFLAPQTGRPPTRSQRKTYLLGSQFLTAISKKIGHFRTSGIAIEQRFHPNPLDGATS